MAKLNGGAEDQLDPAFRRIKELKPVVGRSPSILTQLMERAEVGIAPLWNNNTAALADKGMSIRFVKPDPGPVAVISFFSEITGTRHPELVQEWLDGILSVEYQALAADRPYYFGPTVKGVTVPEAARPYTPSRRRKCSGSRRSTGPRSRRCAARSSIASTANSRRDAGSSGGPAPMLADIRRQPECLARLLGRADELGAIGRRALDARAGRPPLRGGIRRRLVRRAGGEPGGAAGTRVP